MSDVVIRTFLDLSTAHLRQETCDSLNSYEGISADETRYGWLMFVPEDDVDALSTKYDWPDELAPIIKLARDHGCAYVLFDRDAEQTDFLPAFLW